MATFEEVKTQAAVEKGLPEKFDQVLGGKFDRIKHIGLETNLPGIDYKVITPPDKEDFDSVSVVLYYKINGKQTHDTFTLRRNQKDLIRPLSPELKKRGITHEMILREVLDDFERLDLQRWVKVDFQILPPGAGEERELSGVSRGTEASRVDPRRLEFLEKQKGFLVGLVDSEKEFEAYHALVFGKFILVEHPMTNHAAYFVNIPEIADIPPIPEEQCRAWVDRQSWKDIIKLTPGEIRKIADRVIIHRGEDWRARMQAEIDKRK